jgi:hypothetical protein
VQKSDCRECDAALARVPLDPQQDLGRSIDATFNKLGKLYLVSTVHHKPAPRSPRSPRSPPLEFLKETVVIASG